MMVDKIKIRVAIPRRAYENRLKEITQIPSTIIKNGIDNMRGEIKKNIQADIARVVIPSIRM